MTYTVYVLFSEKFDRHYTGYTINLESRILSHNELGTKGYTKRYRPWKLIYSKTFEIKSEAVIYEKWLKSGIGRAFIKTLEH